MKDAVADTYSTARGRITAFLTASGGIGIPRAGDYRRPLVIV